MSEYVYDIETYPNCFLFGAVHYETRQKYFFEVSHRRDDRSNLFAFLSWLSDHACEMTGYNNVGFDYPVIHHFYKDPLFTGYNAVYEKANTIINAPDDQRFSNVIWEKDRVVKQQDLYKINHFDNKARATSLKALEIAMKDDVVEDLPFEPGTVLTDEQIDKTIIYMFRDIDATLRFRERNQESIDFRKELSAKYGRDFTNHNDTKIGKDYFIMELEKHGVECYDSNRKPRQTIRNIIDLNKVIFPYVKFEHPEFNRITNWLKAQKITQTKGVFENLSCTVNGFTFVFGTGGIHGSVESQTIKSNDTYEIIDLDVASFYPNLAIANKLYPEHLGEYFCKIYQDVYEMRKSHDKKSAINKMLKLALNGVYGDSNNQYSPFYDPAYTMSITINGQLLLCMLAEQLMKIPGLSMIQANTDGVTVFCPRGLSFMVDQICKWWEDFTRLQLEKNTYKAMYIRDVNNYIAQYENGDVKRKGAYCHSKDLGWHQDHSSQVVAKAAEAALTRGVDVREFIMGHQDKYDFLIKVKVPRSSKLMMGDREVQKTSRVFISVNGEALVKIMPPTPAQFAKLGPSAPVRRIAQHKGWLATDCNDIKNFDWSALNREYYIQEAEKLVNPLK